MPRRYRTTFSTRVTASWRSGFVHPSLSLKVIQAKIIPVQSMWELGWTEWLLIRQIFPQCTLASPIQYHSIKAPHAKSMSTTDSI